MKCVFCGDCKVEKKLVTFVYEDDDRYLLIENVPADVCLKCGERLYSPEVADQLLRFSRNEYEPKKTIEVPVYNFSDQQ